MLTSITYLLLAIISSLLFTSSISQDVTRNLVYPSSTSTAATGASTSTQSLSGAVSTPTGSAGSGSGVTPINGTSAVNNTGAIHSVASTSTVSLSRIPDATGVNNVPVPVMTGQRANGPFGPDDGYIAAVGRLIIPITFSLGAVAMSMLIIALRV